MLSLFKIKKTVTVDVSSYIEGINDIYEQLEKVDLLDNADFSDYKAAMKACLILVAMDEDVPKIFRALYLAALALQKVSDKLQEDSVAEGLLELILSGDASITQTKIEIIRQTNKKIKSFVLQIAELL